MTNRSRREMEMERGRALTAKRAAATIAAKEAWERKKQEAADEESTRRAEVDAIGRGYEQSYVPPPVQIHEPSVEASVEAPPEVQAEGGSEASAQEPAEAGAPTPPANLPAPQEVTLTTNRSAKVKNK